MNIIKVKFYFNGVAKGRSYTYFSKDPVIPGDIIQINSLARGVVIEIDVPEEEIKDYRDKVKFIYGKVDLTEPEENKEEDECQIKTQ